MRNELANSTSTRHSAKQYGAGVSLPLGLPFADQPGPDGAFWSGAIGVGVSLSVELAGHLDVLSQSIVQLPDGPPASRPAVASYLAMVKTLAAAWSARTRPALLEAVDGLTHVGASLAQANTRDAMAGAGADHCHSAARALAGLQRRVGTPATALSALAAEFDALLNSMARATDDLQSDTLLVSERLQADHVHAFLLSQQASALQSKLDDANMRQDAYWLQGPHSEHIRQEIALHGSALEGVRRQLDHLHAEQAATRSEAHYLQKLMPSLSGYLGAFERMAGGIRAALAGTGAMLGELQELQAALAGDPAALPRAKAALRAALPQWRALATSTARLRPGCRVMTRGARRT